MENPMPLTPAIAPPMASLPVHRPIPVGDGDGYEVSDDHHAARERHERAVHELMQRRRAYAMVVPTNDSAVRARLRRLDEPITLFGETEMERRDRLRALMVRLEAKGQLDPLLGKQGAPGDDDDGTENIPYPFFTEGTNELLQARVDIAMYSLPRAKARLERTKRRRLADPDENTADHVAKQAGNFVLDRSEIGDDRPLTGCSFSRDASMIATTSRSGIIKVWTTTPQITKTATLKGHTERATDVAFSPVDNCFLATSSADKTAKLWNTDGSLLTSFHGHLDRLARLAFHPSGKYLGTASFDKTWRLWDVNTGTQLLRQEGHSRSVYGVSFHPDGSLVASCGHDATARVCDLRSGRLYCALVGHVKPVLGVSFSPNGHLLATASEDNSCRMWDLRTRQMVYCLPAHNSLISNVKFEPREGYYLATSSYDTTAALWSTRDYKPIKRLAGHDSHVTGLDISGDGQQIATVSHDRTIKIWSCGGSAHDNDEMELD